MGELRDKVEGEVKDTGGKLSGDKKMEWEGKAQKAKGKVEEEICSEPAVVDEEADDEPDQCHQEGRDRAHVGELVLEMVPWEDLAKPVLEAGLGGLAGRARRRCGGGTPAPGLACDLPQNR